MLKFIKKLCIWFARFTFSYVHLVLSLSFFIRFHFLIMISIISIWQIVLVLISSLYFISRIFHSLFLSYFEISFFLFCFVLLFAFGDNTQFSATFVLFKSRILDCMLAKWVQLLPIFLPSPQSLTQTGISFLGMQSLIYFLPVHSVLDIKIIFDRIFITLGPRWNRKCERMSFTED